MLGDEPRRAKEQAGEMRGDSPVRVPQRRAVAEPDQREELIQLAVAVDGQDLLPEIAERDGLVLDDRSKDDTHERILGGTRLTGQRLSLDRSWIVGILGRRLWLTS